MRTVLLVLFLSTFHPVVLESQMLFVLLVHLVCQVFMLLSPVMLLMTRSVNLVQPVFMVSNSQSSAVLELLTRRTSVSTHLCLWIVLGIHYRILDVHLVLLAVQINMKSLVVIHILGIHRAIENVLIVQNVLKDPLRFIDARNSLIPFASHAQSALSDILLP